MNNQLKPLCLAALLALAAHFSFAADVQIREVNLTELPKTKKLLMGNFVVEFQESYISTKTGFHILGLGGFNKTQATNTVTLPEPGVLIELTNFAYARTLEKLRAQGWDIVEPDNFKPEGKTAMKALVETWPIQNAMTLQNFDGKSNLYAPTGFAAWVTSSPAGGCDHYAGKQSDMSFTEKLSQTGSAFNMKRNTQPGYERTVTQVEALPMLKVWITVGFGEAKAGGAGTMIAGRQNSYLNSATTTVANAANSNATAGMFLKPEATRFSIQLPAEGDPMNWGFSRGCGTKFRESTFLPPVDGEIRLHLAEKLYDDGGEVAALSMQAGDIKVKDTAIGDHLVQRNISQDAASGEGRQAKSGAVQVTAVESRTTGVVSTSDLGNNATHTQQTYVSTIRADYFATSAFKMIDDVTSAFVERMK
ncbi:hypothetical protein [Rhodoferax sp.]|uniref:hypothetical protein n=1 Tax=Rhodoferax sp. TaxID=50421 RepID=UPI002626BB4D|nr:hypothetical protein [Rhodoferax sp.]MDD2810002.1 hypothetical protein [Rhodoferax sp.]